MKYGLLLSLALFLLATIVSSADSDPSPRTVLLGYEPIANINAPEPAYIYYFVDQATHNEIICFAGNSRETLSCLQTGRKR